MVLLLLIVSGCVSTPSPTSTPIPTSSNELSKKEQIFVNFVSCDFSFRCLINGKTLVWLWDRIKRCTSSSNCAKHPYILKLCRYDHPFFVPLSSHTSIFLYLCFNVIYSLKNYCCLATNSSTDFRQPFLTTDNLTKP